MNALEWLTETFHLDTRTSPVEIPNVGRDDLARWFHILGYRVGAEIGVETGRYAQTLCEANPDLHLYAIDAWQAYRGYREHVSQEKLEGFYQLAQTRLAPYGATLIRKFSIDAAKDVAPASLDFVYIDANHEFAHVAHDLVAWAPKVRSGGIVAGHDYCRRKDPSYHVHVVEAVTGYTQAYGIRPWFVLGTKAIGADAVRDRPRSFCWVVR